MKINLDSNVKKELFPVEMIINSDDTEDGVYLSTLENFEEDYPFLAIVKDVMGECIGLGVGLDGTSYVFNDIGASVEFEGEFYKSDAGITIHP
jgi:hypothetical protein